MKLIFPGEGNAVLTNKEDMKKIRAGIQKTPKFFAISGFMYLFKFVQWLLGDAERLDLQKGYSVEDVERLAEGEYMNMMMMHGTI
jgi:hypothetical protein